MMWHRQLAVAPPLLTGPPAHGGRRSCRCDGMRIGVYALFVLASLWDGGTWVAGAAVVMGFIYLGTTWLTRLRGESFGEVQSMDMPITVVGTASLLAALVLLFVALNT